MIFKYKCLVCNEFAGDSTYLGYCKCRILRIDYFLKKATFDEVFLYYTHDFILDKITHDVTRSSYNSIIAFKHLDKPVKDCLDELYRYNALKSFK